MSLRRCALGLHRCRALRPQHALARPHTTATTAASTRLRAVFLNGERLDYDGEHLHCIDWPASPASPLSSHPPLAPFSTGRLDYAPLSDYNVSWHAASDPAKPEEILARAQGHDILINKEMPLSGALIHALPPSVRLICEVRHRRTLTLTLTPTFTRTQP